MKLHEKNKTARICVGGLLLALGVLLPQCFHMLGGPATGGTFLPMHIPVFIGGILLGDFYGLAIGLATPVLSFLLTGMPPFARLPFMVVELAVYGWVCGLLSSRRFSMPVYVALVGAQIAGRVAYGIALCVGLWAFGMNISPAAAMTGAFVAGLPGIAVQLIAIPSLVLFIKKRMMHVERLDSECAEPDRVAGRGPCGDERR